jgi:putative endonuclease
MKGHFVYILRCKDGSYYTGYTTEINERLRKHELGIASKYTRARLPVALVFTEELNSRSEAQKREHAIKRLRRKEKDRKIFSCYKRV